MTWSDRFSTWLVPTGEKYKTKDNVNVTVWELKYDLADKAAISEWATHFRHHYCPDDEIDHLRHGTGLSRHEFLVQLIFPDGVKAPGPSIRAGDFGEILVSDFVEYILRNWVPRTRFSNRAVRNESKRGSDVVGIKQSNLKKPSKADTLTIFEVKAQLSKLGPTYALQLAIEHSAKDQMRKVETLNSIKQHFIYRNKHGEAARVERFQNPVDNPYKETSGAAAVISTEIDDPKLVKQCDAKLHENRNNLMLVILRGKTLMALVETLYERAAHEA